MRYAGFWRRPGSLLVDALVVLPIAFGVGAFAMHSRVWLMIVTFSITFLSAAYNVYFHAHWGKTIGKMATRIRVVLLDASPIRWRHALLRHSGAAASNLDRERMIARASR